MNKKKNVISVNNIFTNLVIKNKKTLIFLFLISIFTSYVYNNHFKTIINNYSIVINFSELWISENEIIEDVLEPKNFYKKAISSYLKNLPSNIDNKFFTSDEFGNIKVSFISIGDSQAEIPDITRYLNNESKKAVYKKLITLQRNSKRLTVAEKDFNFETMKEDLQLYPLMYKIQKIEEAMNKQNSIYTRKLEQQNQQEELKYYIDNFDMLFSDDIYFSLNGWEITTNKLKNIEILFSGILFGSLICSFFLFFKSNYFRRKLSN